MTPVATPFFFYLLAGIMVIGGIMVITRKNAVHSALALIVTLLAQAAIYLMLYAPFVAGVQIILYAGGIMVLFLFVIMLVNIDRAAKERTFNKQWLVGLVAGLGAGSAVDQCLRKGQSDFSRSHDCRARKTEYAGTRDDALRAIYVPLRDRSASVAGGDYRSGGDGEEENLKSGL